MRWLIIALLMGVLLSCAKEQERLILVSKDSQRRIEKWLLQADSTLIIREFYTTPKDSMVYFLKKAFAIVLGGGEDIHPSIYGHQEYIEVCGEIDLFRDSIEQVLIRHAFAKKLPLLGICRGHQLLNAASGGTLIPDIPSFLVSKIDHRIQKDSAHVVYFPENSWLKIQLGYDSLWVNSRHHQCVDKIAPGFQVAATSADGVVESVQFADTLQYPFMVGVQWHPEGLLDAPSMRIAELFIRKIQFEH